MYYCGNASNILMRHENKHDPVLKKVQNTHKLQWEGQSSQPPTSIRQLNISVYHHTTRPRGKLFKPRLRIPVFNCPLLMHQLNPVPNHEKLIWVLANTSLPKYHRRSKTKGPPSKVRVHLPWAPEAPTPATATRQNQQGQISRIAQGRRENYWRGREEGTKPYRAPRDRPWPRRP